ncbi:spermatogenesis-defective protein 39 homolog [Sinocyclocheilus anshuiensis]|uniref:spermatogenesis-defective protein 39 homolog n=1 Tax=Sinocyclocheilus anshuiensis TaxID=1608454 RepID=UPI0007B86DD5|nr:PREDICTED: spermatogenesis-defective protein 39 homolog [Sinocyclocheilus anshuiensis]
MNHIKGPAAHCLLRVYIVYVFQMSRAKPEDDEYWNSSKFKAFTFDDNDDEFSRLKESKRVVNSILVDDDDEDDVEKVSWSGEPVGSISWSVKETASSIRSGSEQSFPKIDTTPSLSKQGSGYSLSSLFKAKSKPFQSFSESFSDTSVRTYAPELRKPKSNGKVTHMDMFVYTTVQTFGVKIFNVEERRRTPACGAALGRTEDMALMQYKEHLNIKDEGRRRDFLKSCLSLPFSQDDATHVQDHYTLLERQIIIEASDKKADAEIFKKFPRKASILNMPIITTLYYSCFYHYGESEGTFSSPSNIRKTFRISEKQYILMALGARAKLKSWFDVDSLFNTKNWLGYTKKRSPIGFHRVVDILQKNSAPVNVLQEYVNLIDDPELKLSVALKYKCHDIVINTYRDLKDRQELVVYREKLERDSPEYRKIQELLNNAQIRWKN